MINKKIIICAILKNEERNLNNFFQTLKKIKNTITVSFDEWLKGLKIFNQTDFFTNNDEILVDKVCRLEKQRKYRLDNWEHYRELGRIRNRRWAQKQKNE